MRNKQDMMKNCMQLAGVRVHEHIQLFRHPQKINWTWKVACEAEKSAKCYRICK